MNPETQVVHEARHALSALERAGARRPGHLLVADGDGSATYAEALGRAGAIAADLRRAGVQPGDAVGLCGPDSVDLVLAILGCWHAGALPGLLDPRTAHDDLPWLLADVGAALVAAPPALHDRLRAAGAARLADLGALGADRASEPPRHDAGSPLFLSYTSGTTGRPKGAILRSGPVTLGTACIADRLGLRPDDVLLATTPTPSSFQLVAALLPAIHAGATVRLAAGLDAAAIRRIAADVGATVLVAYPLTLGDVLHAPGGRPPFRLALSGGQPLPPRLKRDYRDLLGVPLVESYGQSELGGFMALGRPDDGARALDGFVGAPLPDRPAFPADEAGRELPPGELGQVVVPWGFFDAYRSQPDATAAALAGGVLRTGDLAVADAAGRLRVLGRVGEAPAARRRGGFLREAEDVCHEHPHVLHAAVVEAADGAVEAFAQPLPGRQVDAHDLRSLVAERVAPGVVPSRVTVVEALPRTFSGKTNRLALVRRA